MTLGIGIACGVFGAIIVGLSIYGFLRKRDACALPKVTEFDRSRIPFHLLTDPKFGPRLHEALDEAAEFWNKAIGAVWFISPGQMGEDGSLVPVEPYIGDLEDSRHRRAFAYAHLATNKTRSKILAGAVRVNTIRYDLNDVSLTELRNALAHELGHIMGLAHDDLPRSIMYRKVRDDGATVTDNDVNFLREVYKA